MMFFINLMVLSLILMTFFGIVMGIIITIEVTYGQKRFLKWIDPSFNVFLYLYWCGFGALVVGLVGAIINCLL